MIGCCFDCWQFEKSDTLDLTLSFLGVDSGQGFLIFIKNIMSVEAKGEKNDLFLRSLSKKEV
jgi:hypothetical protein